MKSLPLIITVLATGVGLLAIDGPAATWSLGKTIAVSAGGAALAGIPVVALVSRSLRAMPDRFRIAALVLLLVGGVEGVLHRDIAMNAAGALVSRQAAVASVAGEPGSAAVARHWDGHFRAPALVNGQPVDMMVDTGASLVLLTWEDALKAGLDVTALQFTMRVMTANGEGRIAPVKLASVDIGGVTVTGVTGAVAQPGQLHASLLGMSYLGEIQEAVIRKDKLILRN